MSSARRKQTFQSDSDPCLGRKVEMDRRILVQKACQISPNNFERDILDVVRETFGRDISS